MSSKSKGNPSTSLSTKQGSLFVLHYKSRSVLIGSPKDYDQLQDAIRRHFPEIPTEHRVSYHTDELSISNGAMVEVSEDIWETAVPLSNTLTVQTEPKASTSTTALKRPLTDKADDCDSSWDEGSASKLPVKKPRLKATLSSESSTAGGTSIQASKTIITLNVHKSNSDKFRFRCRLSTSVSALLRAIHNRLAHASSDDEDEYNEDEWVVIWDSQRLCLDNHRTVAAYGMEDGDEIWMRKEQVGGKPVIYLLPPSSSAIGASVKLSLVPEWHFSAIYPIVPIDFLASGGQTLQWDVMASGDGTLLEKNTGLEVAYLFWEAKALALSTEVPPSCISPPAPGYTPSDETFIPTHAQLEPTNSVVLEVAKVTPYLDSALKALGLHTEARTSFITYWLPSFLKHAYIALRFLPQRAYEHAAPLEVSPTPDVVVRVFMLFKGLRPEDVSPASTTGWNEAIGDADVDRWRRVVGVDDDRSLADDKLFRVIEWGGMEVLSISSGH